MTLTATPSAGSVFAGWSGGCFGMGTCTLPMTGATTVTARFTGPPAFSNPDPTPGFSVVLGLDILELRSAINQIRTQRFGLPAFDFADPGFVTGLTVVKSLHFTELRRALAETYAQAGRIQPAYTDPTLTPGVTTVKAAHLNELRDSLRALQ